MGVDNIVECVRGDDRPGGQVSLHVERVGKKRLLEVRLLRSGIHDVQKRKELNEAIVELGKMAGAIAALGHPSLPGAAGEDGGDDEASIKMKEVISLVKKMQQDQFEDGIMWQTKVVMRDVAVREAQVKNLNPERTRHWKDATLDLYNVYSDAREKHQGECLFLTRRSRGTRHPSDLLCGDNAKNPLYFF